MGLFLAHSDRVDRINFSVRNRSAADVGEFTATEEESARLVSRGVLRLGNGYREMGVGAHGFRKGSAWILEAAWLTDFGSDARVL